MRWAPPLLQVARSRNLRRVGLGFLIFNIGEWGTWVATLVYAYDQGGATASGIVGGLLLLPTGLLAPVVSVFADRYPPAWSLVGGYLFQGATMLALAAAISADLPPAVVFAVALPFSVSWVISRPAQAALLPRLTESPDELTATYVVAGWMETAALIAGPGVAAVLLRDHDPAFVFWVFGVLAVLSALPMLPLCRRGRGEEVADEARELPAGLLAAVPEGIAVARESPGVGLLVLVLAGGAVLRGALNVLYVRLAIDDLGMGQGGAGLLNACFGLGAVAAGAGSVLLIGRRGLVGPLYLGVSVSAVALVGLSLHLDRPAAVVAMVAVGAGLALLNVTGRTFLQRITPEAVLGRVFGLLEGVWYAGSGLGSLAVPALIVLGGTRTAVFWVGMMLPVAGVFAWHVLRALDIAGPDRSAQIALLRRYPPFAVLGPPELETLAAALAPLSASPGATVIAEGERGDRFYLITSGEAVVSIGDVDVRTLGPGDGFGEIALLRDSPRTATVTATSPLSLWTLEREPFLLAITHHALAQHAADRHVTVLSGS